jgi:hypothetical protein
MLVVLLIGFIIIGYSLNPANGYKAAILEQSKVSENPQIFKIIALSLKLLFLLSILYLMIKAIIGLPLAALIFIGVVFLKK